MKVRVLYPTMKAMETRAVTPFSTRGLTAEVLRGPYFVCVAEVDIGENNQEKAVCEAIFTASNIGRETGEDVGARAYRQIRQNVNVVKVGASHTTMSVGDAIEIAGRLWVCANGGFVLAEGQGAVVTAARPKSASVLQVARALTRGLLKSGAGKLLGEVQEAAQAAEVDGDDEDLTPTGREQALADKGFLLALANAIEDLLPGLR